MGAPRFAHLRTRLRILNARDLEYLREFFHCHLQKITFSDYSRAATFSWCNCWMPASRASRAHVAPLMSVSSKQGRAFVLGSAVRKTVHRVGLFRPCTPRKPAGLLGFALMLYPAGADRCRWVFLTGFSTSLKDRSFKGRWCFSTNRDDRPPRPPPP